MKISPDQIDPDASKVVRRLRTAGHAAYVVGGCVRDLLLGLKPKDFDVATSAKPNELRHLFRNCRIIGRRFRLAHIFFGSKIIETSTFRANPREGEEEAGESPATEAERQDLLIRRDNVFGSAEEDARRRDFTINGLFYDLDNGQVIDYVNGMVDLEARLVRTIGDPDVRLREDPIRILRAVKFAARCDLTIEPETYRRMLDHAAEIQKCAQARVSEEFYRLLRAGAARRSVEILREMGLLKLMVPWLATALDSSDPELERNKARVWGYLGALDRSTQKRDAPPSNALILATIAFAWLRDALHPDTNTIGDLGQHVAQTTAPLLEQVKASRRDAEMARKILLYVRHIFPSSNASRRRPRFNDRECLDNALRLHEIVSDADGVEPTLIGQPLLLGGAPPGLPPDAEERLARELETPSEYERRRGGGGGGGGGAAEPRPHHGQPHGHGARGPERPTAEAIVGVGPTVRTPIPDLARLGPRAPRRPQFLGGGSFGGRWGGQSF
jgi:poly(A) polymerase